MLRQKLTDFKDNFSPTIQTKPTEKD